MSVEAVMDVFSYVFNSFSSGVIVIFGVMAAAVTLRWVINVFQK